MADFQWNNEQTLVDAVEGAPPVFIGGETVLIAAGPAAMADGVNISGDLSTGADESSLTVIPIAVLQTAAVAQSPQVQKLFEIGSKPGYMVRGRVVGSCALTKVLYNGSNLIKVLYAQNGKTPGTAPDDPGAAEPFWISLTSKVFDAPLGLAFYMMDKDLSPYSAFYLEQCQVINHQLGVQSTSMILSETAQLQFDRIIPIHGWSG